MYNLNVNPSKSGPYRRGIPSVLWKGAGLHGSTDIDLRLNCKAIPPDGDGHIDTDIDVDVHINVDTNGYRYL